MANAPSKNRFCYRSRLRAYASEWVGVGVAVRQGFGHVVVLWQNGDGGCEVRAYLRRPRLSCERVVASKLDGDTAKAVRSAAQRSVTVSVAVRSTIVFGPFPEIIEKSL